MVREHENTLEHHQPNVMTDITTNIIWIESFLQTLDHMDKHMYRCVKEASFCSIIVQLHVTKLFRSISTSVYNVFFLQNFRSEQLYFEMGNTLAAAMEEKLRERYGVK